MQRHTNKYVIATGADLLDTLEVYRGDERIAFAMYPNEYTPKVKLYKWSYKGKNGIVNEFNISLAAFFAEEYELGRNWKHSGSCYAKFTFTPKIAPATTEKLNAIRTIARDNKPKLEYFPFVRWQSKLICEKLTLTVVEGSALTPTGTIDILVNTFLRRYVPTTIKIVDGDFVVPITNEKLSFVLYKAAGGTSMAGVYPPAWFDRSNICDLRIDPNNLIFASTTHTHTRRHRLTITDPDDNEEYDVIVIEFRERGQSTIGGFQYWPIANNNELYRIPATFTGAILKNDGTRQITCNERTSFVMIDAKYDEYIDYVYYNGIDSEFMAYTSKNTDKPVLLKRFLAELSGHKIDNILVPSRMTAGYAKALENSGDRGKWDRRRARYENKAMNEAGRGCFVQGRVLKHRRVSAERSFFVKELYGGVGIWVKDLRAKSIHVKASVTDIRHRKDKED